MEKYQCLHCLEISRRLKDNLDIEDYTINGWAAAKIVASLAAITEPSKLEVFRKLSTYELADGRWCKGCTTKIK